MVRPTLEDIVVLCWGGEGGEGGGCGWMDGWMDVVGWVGLGLRCDAGLVPWMMGFGFACECECFGTICSICYYL